MHGDEYNDANGTNGGEHVDETDDENGNDIGNDGGSPGSDPTGVYGEEFNGAIGTNGGEHGDEHGDENGDENSNDIGDDGGNPGSDSTGVHGNTDIGDIVTRLLALCRIVEQNGEILRQLGKRELVYRVPLLLCRLVVLPPAGERRPKYAHPDGSWGPAQVASPGVRSSWPVSEGHLARRYSVSSLRPGEALREDRLCGCRGVSFGEKMIVH